LSTRVAEVGASGLKHTRPRPGRFPSNARLEHPDTANFHLNPGGVETVAPLIAGRSTIALSFGRGKRFE
jgi:hypothetical protein